MGDALALILNVNDHEQTRYMCTRMLELAGFDVIEAATGEEALLQARGRHPDVIVLDVKLPDMSGFEVCRLIKSAPDTQSICVLQTSATFVTVEKKIEGLDSGADAYLTHPFEPAELIATVHALLRIRAAERELRRRADALLEADKRKDEFLAMLAHELRNPLAAITTAMPLLRKYCNEPDRFDGIAGVVERQSRHLARLIDDLLDVSRFSRGKIDLRRSTIDLRHPLADAVAASRAVFAARDQALEVHVPEDPQWLIADAARLQQVFSNLLDNASKYSERGTRVTVEMSRELVESRPFGRVVVRDEGIGIEPSVMPHVFELFVQADHSLERTRGGMGIGLTLVKRLVELHGGEVIARSAGLGKGSEFELRLPLSAAPSLSPSPSRSSVDPWSRIERAGAGEPAPRSILLVEDNADAREMLQAVLEVAGHKVEVARDGLTGVERALAGAHDLAIVDIGLPGLNGYEVAQRIRAARNGAGRPLYLIALTGYGGNDQRDRAIGAGFDVHLVKPINPDALLRLISTVDQ
jgi:two-component system, sensor histidine kinase